MARFVPDCKTNRWVVIAPTRVERPHDNSTTPEGEKKAPTCPFCPGSEGLNKELFRVGEDGGWGIRVIANKYPITDLHEVIIHSPDHERDIDELPLLAVELILKTYRQRFNFHTRAGNGQVMIFNNHDLHAGASIRHPHSQVVVVPRQINLDSMVKEPVRNVVTEGKNFTLYCPDFSQWPYEIWIAPSGETKEGEKGKTFGEVSDEEISELAGFLQKTLKFLVQRFSEAKALRQKVEPHVETGEVPYNYYIYHGENWYLRIIPRLVHRAGFELGSGLSVNIVDPVEAAKEYRAGMTETS